MRPGARLAAAIEILADTAVRRRPTADAVKDWMLSHRFAGSKDRAAIGDLVFGALRWRASSAFLLGADDPRAWVLGAVRWGFKRDARTLETAFYEDPHAPAPLTEAERAALAPEAPALEHAPAHIAGDYPEWLDESLARQFGESRALEGRALAAPAPLDLRANALKTTRAALLEALGQSTLLREPAGETPFAPHGVRIPWAEGRAFPYASELAFQRGWFEVQDEASQLAAGLSGAKPGMQVGDVCAGGGGKTLALAAMMHNQGQIYAHDIDARRLAPVHQRLERAGVRNVQIRAPLREGDVLADLRGRLDLVLVDAPCTGSGTWRRAPDSKWRLRPNALARRLEEQQSALDLAAPLVRIGGTLLYVTCSILPEENQDAVARFAARTPAFRPLVLEAPAPAHKAGPGLLFTPHRTGTDGFFIAALTRAEG